MRNTKPSELDVVLGAAVFAAAESVEPRPQVDTWISRTEVIESFLDDGNDIDDIAYPTTAREEGRVEFRLSDEFLEHMVTRFFTQALIEFYENTQ